MYTFLEPVKVNNIRIKEVTTRWGSCSSKGNINYNWKIIMAPMDVLDYVVVHELCHLKEMNHSYRFWREVEFIIKDYKEKEVWLKKNSQKFIL